MTTLGILICVICIMAILFRLYLFSEQLFVYLKKKSHKPNLDNVVLHNEFTELRKHLNE